MSNPIHFTAKIGLVLVFLVILAGSVVRMTGSGMGCPDWPKCFGYYIPPTDVEQVTWRAQKEFAKGTMVILKDKETGAEQLYAAKKDFKTGTQFQVENWEVFNDHDYTTFVTKHTWIEYINRLLGALSGIPALLLIVLSIKKIRYDRRPFMLSLAILVVLGFVAWLGKKVVEGNLIPGSITIHMLGAIVLVALYVGLIVVARGKTMALPDRDTRYAMLALAVLGIAQIVFGSQVREFVDTIVHGASHVPRNDYFELMLTDRHDGWKVEIHRTIAWLVLGAGAFLFYRMRKANFTFKLGYILIGLILGEILLGIIMAYAGIPAFAQPLHLLFAVALFAASWWGWQTSFVERKGT